MKKKTFIISSALGVILALVILGVVLLITNQNKAINLEEQINESKSAIEVQEKRRVDLILNLVDTVQAYDIHEKETLTQLVEARSNANNGKVEDAQMVLSAVAEAYPELKSQQNYKELMNELSATENLVAEYRNNYNIQIKAYNKHIRKFPNSLLLGLLGYEKIEAEYLEYNAPSDAPTNLFNKE